ncbi:Hypp1036 [Branchiostoma lanceolatum]|uniref:Hypp1036 protein n=1 Tax=Branchiostoma lanceolatum TaxID=7740 RepID=A0A8J9ZFW6_BRALA|nr:Hypp1036 [Branchiostoma lanceolatum]
MVASPTPKAIRPCKRRVFEAVWSGKNWSHFIYSINGLKEMQPAAESYTVWAFGDGERNSFHRDVDLVSVKDGDIIEFLYTRFK